MFLATRGVRSRAWFTLPTTYQSVWESPLGVDTGSGHRSGHQEGRTAPPRGFQRPATGVARIVAPSSSVRNRPTVPRRRRSTTQPMSQPVTKNRPSPDPYQRINQLQQGRGVSKAVEREEGLQGHHAHPASHRTPQVCHFIMGSLLRHGLAIGETDIRVSLAKKESAPL